MNSKANMLFDKFSEDEALHFIKEHEPPEGYMGLFSGGKDSCVIKHLAKQAGVKAVWYYSLMPDPPQLIRFIKQHHPDVKILRPKYNFYEGITINFPPNRKARWCCRIIKEEPSTKIKMVHRLVGIRAEESSKRAKLGRINAYSKKRINYHPIYSWRDCDVWQYIEDYKIPVCDLYDHLDRLGCVVCPLRTNSKPQEVYRKLFPKQFALFEKKVGEWWEAKGQFRDKNKEPANSAKEYLENWYKGK